MRRLALLSAAVAAVIGHAAEPSGIATTTSSKPFLGLVQAPNSSVSLARLNPLSLRRVSPQLDVGEYHDTWSLSPDASQLALGVSSGESVLNPSRRLRRRIGIYIVDLQALKLVQEVETGIAAEALGWVARRRLVAGLQRGGTVLVDPLTGRILRRWPGFSFPDVSARVGNALVMLFPDLPLTTAASATPRLAVVDAQGRLRSVKLRRIQLAVRSRHGTYYMDRAGLAIDPTRARAYVFAADAPAAQVDLHTMRVSYHRLDPLFLRPGELQGSEARPKNAVLSRERRAVWVGDRYVVVFGRDVVTGRGRSEALIPAGAALVNTATWKWRTLDRSATGAAFVAGRVVVYGPGWYPAAAGIGLRAYALSGGRTFYIFKGKRVFDVQVAADLAYVRTPSAVHVVDVRSGKVVNKVAPPRDLVDVIVGSH
jgi:hypothetical protein